MEIKINSTFIWLHCYLLATWWLGSCITSDLLRPSLHGAEGGGVWQGGQGSLRGWGSWGCLIQDVGKYTEQPAEGKKVLCTSQVLVNAKLISPHVKMFTNICLSMTEAVKLMICVQKQDTVSYIAR